MRRPASILSLNFSAVTLALAVMLNACSDSAFTGLDRAAGTDPEGAAALDQKADDDAAESKSDEKNSAGKKDSDKDKANEKKRSEKDAAPGEGSCSDKDGQAEKIHISESLGVHNLEKSAAIAMHVAGNQNQVNLNAKAGEAGIPSLCAKVTGNENKLTVNVSGKIQNLMLEVMGNSAYILVNVPAGASLGAIDLKTRGNEARVEIKGAGTFDCAAAQTDAKEGSFSCQK